MYRRIFSLAIALSSAVVLNAAGPFSGKLNDKSIREVCDKVADWQINHFDECPHSRTGWHNGALYVGMFAWAEQAENEQVFEFLKKVGTENKWHMEKRQYHADDICVGQAFINMYGKYRKSEMIIPVRERAYYVANHPSKAPLSKKDKKGKDERWSWCDALFMAPPVYAALYRMTGDEVYLNYMDSEYRVATDSLYDRDEHLYYRDCIRIPRREPNGAKQFWARGNGWVYAGLTLIMNNLPASHPSRSFYEQIYLEMSERLVELQDNKGSWHTSLLDYETYPDAENSGSAFFTYGLAWGIRNGMLQGDKYSKAMEKGWKALVSYVDKDGKLGYVQQVAGAPGVAGPEATEVYGVGAMLLAGSEISKLICSKLIQK